MTNITKKQLRWMNSTSIKLFLPLCALQILTACSLPVFDAPFVTQNLMQCLLLVSGWFVVVGGSCGQWNAAAFGFAPTIIMLAFSFTSYNLIPSHEGGPILWAAEALVIGFWGCYLFRKTAFELQSTSIRNRFQISIFEIMSLITAIGIGLAATMPLLKIEKCKWIGINCAIISICWMMLSLIIAYRLRQAEQDTQHI